MARWRLEERGEKEKNKREIMGHRREEWEMNAWRSGNEQCEEGGGSNV